MNFAGSANIERVLSVALVGLATGLYFLSPFSVPLGHFKDTASIALNAFCLQAYGTDEYGKFDLVAIRSFGDYKPPVYTLMITGITRLMPLSLNGMRLVSMVCGFSGVCCLARLLTKTTWLPVVRSPLAIATGFVLVLLSPWVMVTDRFAVEATLVFPLAVIQLSAMIALLSRPSFSTAIAHGLALGVGSYVYHPLKLTLITFYPILLLLLLYQQGRKVVDNTQLLRAIVVSCMTAGVLNLPIALDLLHDGKTMARLGQTGQATLAQGAKQLLQHIDGRFLFWTGDLNLRHHSGFMGMLNIALAPLLVFGIVSILRPCDVKKELNPTRRILGPFIVISFFLGFIPSSMTLSEVPHALRSITSLLPSVLLAMWGAHALASRHPTQSRWIQPRHILALLGTVGIAFALAGAWDYQTRYTERVAAQGSWSTGVCDLPGTYETWDVSKHDSASVFCRLGLIDTSRAWEVCTEQTRD